jgi:hypothetical protein
LKGIQEVWYGSGQSCIYKLASGTILCSNQTFQDPAVGKSKSCFTRDITKPENLPPDIDTLPLTLQPNDLLTTQNKRYSLHVWDGNVAKPVTAELLTIDLKATPTPQRLQQKYFQFDITDGKDPVHQHSVFISPTFDRCPLSADADSNTVANNYGRVMEIYSMTAIPSSKMIPQRSDIQKICTNDKGPLTFSLSPPGIDSFQIKIVSFDARDWHSSVSDFFIPINFEWRERQ